MQKENYKSRFLNCIQLNSMELICIFFSSENNERFESLQVQMHRGGRNAFEFLYLVDFQR